MYLIIKIRKTIQNKFYTIKIFFGMDFIDYINYVDKAKRGGGNSSRTGKVHKLEHISLLLTDTYTL